MPGKPNPTEEAVARVMAALPHDRSAAISRADLAEKTSLDDRTVRACIERLRRGGCFIVTAPRGGYYLTVDLAEIERQYRIDRSRALSVLARLKAMRAYLKENGVAV